MSNASSAQVVMPNAAHAAQRPDLQFLSLEALSQLSNPGLVKRAVREHQAGLQPQLQLHPDGRLQATFPDGAQVDWPLQATLPQARCSCLASAVCRHRLVTVLQWQQLMQQAPPAAGTASDTDKPAPVEETRPSGAPSLVSPAQVSDEDLSTYLPAAMWRQARQQRDKGDQITVSDTRHGEPCPTARLPTATVRYWGGATLSVARCDCVAQHHCEHIALGVWAFRRAAELHPDGVPPCVQVSLGRYQAPWVSQVAQWQSCLNLVSALAIHGVVQGPAALTYLFGLANDQAQHHQARWIVDLLKDLSDWWNAYAQRRSRYDPMTGVELLTELTMRLRLASHPDQRAAEVLGLEQAQSVVLDKVRLMCVGMRLHADDTQRGATLMLVDPDTQTPLVLRHEWQVPEEATPAQVQHALTAERVAPSVLLTALGEGQVLAHQAQRLANGEVQLAQQYRRRQSPQNECFPQNGNWSVFGPPLRHESWDGLHRLRHVHRHPMLAPRHATGRFVVVVPAQVADVIYDAHTLTVQALLYDAQHRLLMVRRRYQPHARAALATLALTLSGQAGALKELSGDLCWEGEMPVLEPWSVVTSRQLWVLDMAHPSPEAQAALAALPTGLAVTATEHHPLYHLLHKVKHWCAQVLHHGLTHGPPSILDDVPPLCQALRGFGWTRLADALAACGHTLREQQTRQTLRLTAPSPLWPAWQDLLFLRQCYEDALAKTTLANARHGCS